ncbi:hypothetical protein KBD49_01585 [Myxococcota bacterium]|jgi:hypothetical protein|nr:hypothetical protein [Myxococcota bacterium]
MHPGDFELEWSRSGPGIRLRGSPLWFDAWPDPGAGFLSSLDALAGRRVRGQVLCHPELARLLEALRPGVRALPLAGTIGLGRLRLAVRATGTSPGSSCLLVERGADRLLYLREGDEAFVERAWNTDPGARVDTLLWSSRARRGDLEGAGKGEAVPDAGFLEEVARDQDRAICLVLDGLGSALETLGRLRGTPRPIRVPPGIRALCRAGTRQGLELPPVRDWDGGSPIPPGAVALWVASGKRTLPGACSRGEVWWRRVVLSGSGPGLVARAFRAAGAVRLVLSGPGASGMQRSLADLGVAAEVIGPPPDPSLF